ncbi:ribonuclease P protein component [Cellvibrio japonicus]|uniref:Ribonuclease P protein component n=1 Tax=Cellvibrio japonicus (strain Ueda107) TaxID=498211 RepID=B3PIU3_CELJU|nr:ribonuclease P protein component [Cellvibrio japonicus]ACE84132.1 ribonuclease P protein component [Cellvibrio japonicus Ueda107]QEI14003.1 ribonuclease P protein component [Cellvibrio japonicus]QEI17577.1 ribonuclease P protein component [Cellvibrio japonicus]QEI21153.1 ribonuclease P protein component [Cellvibrio japonicus]
MKQAFGKSLRLLCSRDFQTVFDDAPFRASHQLFLILSRPNQLPHPRLGLVIAKKHVSLAVQRNRIKRLVREQFRLQQQELAGLDVIVLSRKGVADLENAEFVAQFRQQLQRILKKARQREASSNADTAQTTARQA